MFTGYDDDYDEPPAKPKATPKFEDEPWRHRGMDGDQLDRATIVRRAAETIGLANGLFRAAYSTPPGQHPPKAKPLPREEFVDPRPDWRVPEPHPATVEPKKKKSAVELIRLAEFILAMPAPTKVPTTRNQWIKEHERLEKKRDKTGLPVELVPNFDDDWDNQVYDQQYRWQHLRGGRGSWYADPLEYEGKGQPGIAHRQKTIEQDGRNIPINYLIHHSDEGQINGILSHFPEGTPHEKPGSITVTVHPSQRGKGIGSALVNAAHDKFGIDLEQQQYTPLGYEMYRNVKRQRGESASNIFNGKDDPVEKAAAFIRLNESA
jgi:GNAT superfamily N-acetyltransferase